MMLKRSALFLLILCLIVFSFAGCKPEETGGTKTEAPETTKPAVSASSESTPKPSPTPTPTPTPSSAVTEYSIEMDFQIEKRVLGVVFGFLDDQNYLMWQVNIFDYESEQQVTFKPHVWVDGQYQIIDQFEISEAIKWEDRNKTHRLKITVNEENEITTYINDVKVHTYKDDYAEYGLFGFRACRDEAFYVDNVVITNTANNEVLEKLDFESGDNPFYEGEIVEDVMESPALYLEALSISGPDMCILE